MTLPRAWSARRLRQHCGRAGLGVLLSNLDRARLDAIQHDLRGLPMGACTTAWNVSPLPAGYVMIDITEFAFPFTVPPSRLPLSLRQFRTSELACACVFRSAYIAYRGRTYEARVWIGGRAKEVDRQRLRQVIGSITGS